MKLIKEFATSAPLVIIVTIAVGLTALNRWAAKGDGIDR